MTVQVDSQPTDQNMWYIDMCCINNSISCLEKKTTFKTYEQTCYVDFNVGPPHIFISLKFTHPKLIGRLSVKLVLFRSAIISVNFATLAYYSNYCLESHKYKIFPGLKFH